MKTTPPQREMEKAFRSRDREYDGIFYLAVKTTGIFCRPSCPARKPLARNVEYFAATKEALFAGYRPCKRCRPLDANGQPPDWVERLLALVESAPDARIRDADLRESQIDPARARRYFKGHYGMTFQAYSRARRMGQALHQIRRGANLDDVTYGHGFESQSGFRDAFARVFGQAPGQSRGADCIVTQMIESPIGPLVAGATSKALCFLEFTDRRAFETQIRTLHRRYKCAIVPGKNAVIEKLTGQLAAYFAGKRNRFTIPLEYRGTPFQESVWGQLLKIPYGETLSYEQLARKVDRPGAQRAVGTANGQNRVSILIPCHRVINKSGKLGGYGGGLWRKQFLLDLEQGRKPSPKLDL